MSRVAPKHRAPKPEPLAQPDGCFRCGIGGLLGWYGERWWCPDHFFKEPGKRWPRPMGHARLEESVAIDTKDRLFERGVKCGLDRYNDSKKRKDTAGARKSLRDDLMGAVSEAFLAQAINQTWHATVGQFRGQKPDVGEDIEVRYSHHPGGKLIVRPGDSLQRRYALAVAPFPQCWVDLQSGPLPKIRPEPFTLRFPGWRFGYEIAVDRNLLRLDPSRPSCWAAEQQTLRPISELRNERGSNDERTEAAEA